eukprot:10616518-Lingulodinium_polyedra.AAC.1
MVALEAQHFRRFARLAAIHVKAHAGNPWNEYADRLAAGECKDIAPTQWPQAIVGADREQVARAITAEAMAFALPGQGPPLRVAAAV